MIEVADYLFPGNSVATVCTHVWEGHPVLFYVHDRDGDIQFYCGKPGHAISDALTLSLAEIKDHLQSLQGMAPVGPGFCAERRELGGAWQIRKLVT